MSGHVEKLGRGLERAVSGYNDFVGSLERNVLPQARKFKELRASDSGVEIEPLSPVELTARKPQAPELLANTDGDRTKEEEMNHGLHG